MMWTLFKDSFNLEAVLKYDWDYLMVHFSFDFLEFSVLCSQAIVVEEVKTVTPE